MKVVITCGGTGGHIYPAIAIADQLKGHEISFIGTSNRMESKIVPENGYNFYSIPTSRKNPLIILLGLTKALALLIKIKPNVILSTGGYVTLPICIAGLILRKKIVLQEQNTIPGKVNRLIGKFAYKIALGMPVEDEYFPKNKAILTGNPIRPMFLNPKESSDSDNDSGIKDIPTEHKKLLIIGGSQGASIFNETIIDLLKSNNLSKTTIILITGENNYQSTIDQIKSNCPCDIKREERNSSHIVYSEELNVIIYPYTNNIPQLMRVSDAVMARSGASTLAEVSALGKASILIPYPYAADNHQYYNAKLYQDNQAAILIEQEQLSSEKLEGIITMLFWGNSDLKIMQSNAKKLNKQSAAETIADIVLKDN